VSEHNNKDMGMALDGTPSVSQRAHNLIER